MAESALLQPFEQVPTKGRRDPTDTVKGRQTEEIVLAVCGYIGAGTSDVVKTLIGIFEQYQYTVKHLKVSDIIRDKSGIEKGKKDYNEVIKLQEAGNSLRKKYGDNSYLAQCIIEKISLSRAKDKNPDDITTPESRRHITIIDSLKHPDEYELLSLIYGEMFYLVGVTCPDDKRRERLKGIDFSTTNIEDCIVRDRKQIEKHGQQTAEILYKSDFFVDNGNDIERTHKEQLERFVEIVLGKQTHSPTNDEYAMFCAHASGLRSGCLSRQVGASIMKNGVLLATGRNDVPKNCGGLYCEDDGGNDHRCFHLNPPACKSDAQKKKLITEIASAISTIANDDLEVAGKIYDAISSNTMIKGLIEYSRAVHAEMDAITSAARLGGISLLGATLYSTAFPCHHCARHILSSGIIRIVYIEPYDKSLAYELHKDSIAVDVSKTSEINKLHVEHFRGVSPKRYVNLFSFEKRKDSDGMRINSKQHLSKPYHKKLIDTFIDYELKVLQIKKDNEAVGNEKEN